MFDTVLQSFCAAQCTGALDNIPLTLGYKTKTVNLKVPLAFIIGDIQGGDGICGRSPYYQLDACCICCMCDATSEMYDSSEVDNCNLLVMEDMKELSLTKHYERLRDLMQTPNWLAFFDIDYGGSPGGVFTAACPPEALHSLENGLINHCLKELFDRVLSNLAKCHLDAVVQQWILYPKQRHMKNYAAEFPRLVFSDGVTSITDISAGTKVGILFAIVVAALTKDEWEVFIDHAQMPNKRYYDIIQTFEMLLCYWAWLKKINTGNAMIQKHCNVLKLLYVKW